MTIPEAFPVSTPEAEQPRDSFGKLWGVVGDVVEEVARVYGALSLAREKQTAEPSLVEDLIFSAAFVAGYAQQRAKEIFPGSCAGGADAIPESLEEETER